jgi:hypothetical protein
VSDLRSRLFAVAAVALAGCLTAPNPIYCERDDPQNGCPADRPRCDLPHRQCVAGSFDGGLAIDLSTSGDARVGSDGNMMVDATVAPDLAKPECAISADCKDPKKPVCDTGVCRPCAQHAECASLLCLPSGTCAPSVIFVDNHNCQGGDGSSPQKALCEVQAALALADKSPGMHFYARVAASSTSYAACGLAAGQIELYADPPYKMGGAGPWATIAGANQPSVTLSGTQSQLTLDGFEITGSTMDAIICTTGMTGPKLTVSRSWLHDVSGAGLNGTKCIVTVERDVIGPGNARGGIALTDGGYTIENSFVVENAGFKPGIAISGAAAGTLRFVSIGGNGGVALAGGLACNAPVTLQHSILWGNSSDGLGSPVSGTCTFDDDDLQSGILLGNSNQSLAPDFVDAGAGHVDYHLKMTAASTACCVDKLPKAMMPNPDDPVDLDGTSRPLGAGYDRGAHELQ